MELRHPAAVIGDPSIPTVRPEGEQRSAPREGDLSLPDETPGDARALGAVAAYV
jgi:hypothetical protein